MIAPSGVIVGRTIVRADHVEQGSARDGLARTISGANADRVLDSSDAILCIRRLSDPLPGGLRFDLQELDPPEGWREGLRAALVSLAREAEFPADGPVRPTANAILFRNRAEMLACLAFDWSTPGGRTQWWWHRLVPATPDAVMRAWLDEPEALPAAIEWLRDRDRLAAGFETFGTDDVLQICRVLAVRYGLSLITAAITAGPGVVSTVPRWRTNQTESQRDPTPAPPPSGSLPQHLVPARAPLFASLPEWFAIPERLRSHHQALAVLGLAIQAGRAREWAPTLASAIVAALDWCEPTAEVAADHRRGPTPTPAKAKNRTSRSKDRRFLQAAAETPTPTRLRGKEMQRRMARAEGGESQRTGQAIGPDRGVIGEKARVPMASGRVAQTAAAQRVATASLALETPSTPIGERVETHLGGVFYILNAALALRLYGDFTQPETPGIDLDPWDFVAIMSRRLGAARTGDARARDPIWDLLGKLAGRRTGMHRRSGFRPPSDWRIDPEWLTPFDHSPGLWRWSATHGRVRVFHPAGFTVINIACPEADGSVVARRELQRYDAAKRLQMDDLQRPPLSLPSARWIDATAEYLRARLVSALNLRDAGQLGRTLFRHDALIEIAASRVNVTFSLGQHPIAIRAAGLDRDPGWIPAARRDIRFHYI